MHVEVGGQLCSVGYSLPLLSGFWRIQIEFRFPDLRGKYLLLLKQVSHEKSLLKSEKTSGRCQGQQNERFIATLLMQKQGLQLCFSYIVKNPKAFQLSSRIAYLYV